MLSEYVETAKLTEKINKDVEKEVKWKNMKDNEVFELKLTKLKDELKKSWLEHMVEVIEKVMKDRWTDNKPEL